MTDLGVVLLSEIRLIEIPKPSRETDAWEPLPKMLPSTTLPAHTKVCVRLCRITWPSLSVLLLSLMTLTGCYRDTAQSGSKQNSATPVSNQFQTDNIRIADMEPIGRAAFPAAGVDILNWGEIEGLHLGSRDFTARLRGALPGTTYQIEFCSFSTALNGCIALGSVTTDGNGDTTRQLTFANQGTYTGVFVFNRNGIRQFVTGFAAPAPSSPESNVFDEDLQRAASIGAGLGFGYAAAGDDPLGSGEVEVDMNANVTVRLRGAPASTAYNVNFCRFGMDPTGCLSVGTFNTNQSGAAQSSWVFPIQGRFAGIFILSRQVMGQNFNQLVTGFQTP